MSKFKAVALVAGIGLALWMGPVGAQEGKAGGAGTMQMKAQASEVHLTGEVIDVACYVRMDSKGVSHAQCGTYCVKQGGPLGLLEEKTGKIYLIFPKTMGGNPGAGVLDFVGKRVEVTGKVQSRGGVNGLTVQKILEAKE